jgi:tripartite-type tricarboxylate transporter receptor subunit TctC
MKNVMWSCAVLAGLYIGACPAADPPYPSKPIRMLVGFGAGGAADVLGRILAQKLTETWGQTVVVDNRPGATTTIAADTAANSRPDGYTLLVITSAHAVSAGLYRKLNYDPVKSFTPITLIASAPLVLVAAPAMPAKNIAELIAAAKASPGKITFGSSGTGSITYLAGELLKARAGIDILHVPYKAMSQLQTDLMGGNIQLAFTSIPAGIGQIKAGKIRALGVTSAKRSPSLPDVRTIAESGVAGYEVSNWYGVLAPAGVPKDIVAKLHAQIVKSVQTPEGVDAITKQGADPEVNTPEEFRTYLASEVTKWEQLIKAAGIQAE